MKYAIWKTVFEGTLIKCFVGEKNNKNFEAYQNGFLSLLNFVHTRWMNIIKLVRFLNGDVFKTK